MLTEGRERGLHKNFEQSAEYDLGWDHAMYRLTIPESLGVTGRQGYELGKEHFGANTKTADRYVKKWLQLRMNAFRRERLVNPDVTPAFIKAIDNQYCPVTLMKLTHGELAGSDWSVDRVNNNGAYARDNLAVISTKANAAKGKKSFEDVVALSELDHSTDGLSPREWLRLACIMYGPSYLEMPSRDRLMPLATKLLNHLVRPAWFQMQYYIVLTMKMKTSHRKSKLSRLAEFSDNDELLQTITRVADRLESLRLQVSYSYDAMVDSRLQEDLQKWFRGLSEASRAAVKEYVLQQVGGAAFQDENVRQFSFRTHGYVR